MFNIYETLRNYKYFIDNEYLKKYCRLVEQNKHHIVPKSWFKLNGVDVNNDLNNLVKLSYREHVMAHYYLCLCTEDPFKYANQLALICLLSRKKLNPVDKYLVKTLPLYNIIYADCRKKQEINYKLYERK